MVCTDCMNVIIPFSVFSKVMKSHYDRSFGTVLVPMKRMEK